MVKRSRGFTLIELMLVVAIIGLLAAIALPKFANLVVKAKEASVKGKLGAVRSAVSIYYSDLEGVYPSTSTFGALTLRTVLATKYMDGLPYLEIPAVPVHVRANENNPGIDDTQWLAGKEAAWSYLSQNGQVNVNCTHTDSKGTTWSLW